MLKQAFYRFIDFLEKITHVDHASGFILKKASSRIFVTSLRGFERDKCRWQAAALTFYTILSIIPAFAVAFGIAKGFGLELSLEAGLKSALHEHAAMADKIIEIAYNYIEEAKGGLIGGVGVIFLLLTTILLIHRVEESFNAIWRIPKSRNLIRMVTDYLTIVIFCPLFIIISSSVSIYIATTLKGYFEQELIVQLLDYISVIAIHLLPIMISWLLFSLIYLLIPNTKIPLRYAFFSGIIAGTLYQLLQWGYIFFQVRISNLGAIYGSFAALPLFFIWLNLSWMIVLLGVEISYHSTIDKEEKSIRESRTTNQVKVSLTQLGILAMLRTTQRFANHSPPLSPYSFATEAGISIEQSADLFKQLKKTGLIVEVRTQGKQEAYSPAYTTKDITIHTVVNALNQTQEKTITANALQELLTIEKQLSALDSDIVKSPHNTLVNTISPPLKNSY